MRYEMKTSGTSLAQFAERIGKLGTQARQEMTRGLNDAGDQVRTITRHAIQDQMGVLRYSTVVKAVLSRPATEESLTYDIFSSQGGLPITDFRVTASKGSPVTAHVWGVDVTFQRSFMTSEKGYLRARLGPQREPIRALYGPSPRKELVKEDGNTVHAFDAAVVNLVEPLVFRRLVGLAP